MRFKQAKPNHLKPRRKNRLYSPTSLTNAFLAVKNDGMAVRTAVTQFAVPRTTLRDRLSGKIDSECVNTGRAPVLTLDEEAKLVEHVKVMANYGYGYTRQEVVDVASDYCVQLKKRTREESLTLKWFRGFIKRWPELRVLKPRSLEIQRAKCATASSVDKYFKELGTILAKYNLTDKPHLIFNVDEKGISVNHKPPSIVGSTDAHPPAVTSGKSQTITVLGCRSAAGVAIPPFFVFPGKRMNDMLMNGASAGSDCALSESGWSNSLIFERWLTEHFIKFAPGRNDDYVLILFDGHKSHIAVDLIKWAQDHRIILHVLPAHTSHILQPLDVGCYGPFQKIYDNECHKRIRSNSSVITKFNIAEIACKVYPLALSPQNLQSAFKKTGIFPFDESVVTKESLMPSEVFLQVDQTELECVNSQNDVHFEIQESDEVAETETTELGDFFNGKISSLKKIKGESSEKTKERKTLGKIVSGCAITEEKLAEKVKTHVLNQKKPVSAKSVEKTTSKSGKTKTPKISKKSSSSKSASTKCQKSPEQGPSRIYIDEDSELSCDEDEIKEEELCCVCGKFTPEKIRQSYVVEFANWVQCDNDDCKHWVHLKYCTHLTAVRRGTNFFCHHCIVSDLQE